MLRANFSDKFLCGDLVAKRVRARAGARACANAVFVSSACVEGRWANRASAALNARITEVSGTLEWRAVGVGVHSVLSLHSHRGGSRSCQCPK